MATRFGSIDISFVRHSIKEISLAAEGSEEFFNFNVKDVSMGENHVYEHTVGVCVQPVFYLADWSLVIQFFESWLAQGATKFYFYAHSYTRQARTRKPEDREAYLSARREAKKAVAAKSHHHKALYDMLDTREEEWAVYRLVRARHHSTLDREHTKIVKGVDGAVLRRSGQILERWQEYYNHLCNEEFCHLPIPTVPSVEGPVLPITAVEVSAALAKMKSNKATGLDDILVDVWKLLGDRASVWVATLFNKIVAEGRTPDV
ncbi:hypothetical protein NECAME_06213 [Necator americanus]|uniref:Glycosyltransferase family 92 protein n=1 Tax=Necator americanus TaxID=51031 RepID=W2TXN0_NECAM|nr:hypothetical protein NECAME_06213 [Necator americanus]ETN85796.1 hypothetical protein NECAME_06213 [Necator americanus]